MELKPPPGLAAIKREDFSQTVARIVSDANLVRDEGNLRGFLEHAIRHLIPYQAALISLAMPHALGYVGGWPLGVGLAGSFHPAAVDSMGRLMSPAVARWYRDRQFHYALTATTAVAEERSWQRHLDRHELFSEMAYGDPHRQSNGARGRTVDARIHEICVRSPDLRRWLRQ